MNGSGPLLLVAPHELRALAALDIFTAYGCRTRVRLMEPGDPSRPQCKKKPPRPRDNHDTGSGGGVHKGGLHI